MYFQAAANELQKVYINLLLHAAKLHKLCAMYLLVAENELRKKYLRMLLS